MVSEAGMSSTVKSILTELRERLSGLGYNFVSGRMIDLQSDTLPAIALKMGDRGVQSDENGREDTARAISRQTLYLTIVGCVQVTSFSTTLETLEDLETEIREAVFTPRDRTLKTASGKHLARSAIMLTSRQSYVPDEHSDVGLVEMNIEVPYIENYGSPS